MADGPTAFYGRDNVHWELNVSRTEALGLSLVTAVSLEHRYW
jgi:hypothetical protein